jgi:ABC-type multidrug transport system fused ATPase/permease subunit
MSQEIRIPIKRYWALLHTYLKPQWPPALLLTVLLFSHIGVRLVAPQIMRFFVDTALAGGELRVLIGTAALFISIAIGSQALGIATTWVGENVAWRATNALRQDLTLHCLKLDSFFHKAHTAGELISRVDGDVNTLSNFFSQLIISMVGNTILLASILVLLFLEDWRLGLSMLAFSGVALVVLVTIRTLAIPQWKIVREQMAEFYGFVGEQFAGTEDIRANGAGGYALNRFLNLVRGRLKPTMRSGLGGYGMWILSTILFGLSTALVYGLCAYLWQQDLATIGTIYLIIHYTALMRDPIAQIRTQLSDLQQAEASIAHIETLLDTQSRLAEPAPSRALPVPGGALAVRAVDKLLRGRTGLIIAHRLATVQRADEILILDQGRILERGPRAALASDPGSHFAQLLKTGLEEVLA